MVFNKRSKPRVESGDLQFQGFAAAANCTAMDTLPDVFQAISAKEREKDRII